MIEFDVETTGLQWYAGKEVFLAQFFDGFEAELFPSPGERDLIQQRLSVDDDYRAWNAKFDLHFLESSGYTLPPENAWHDGMVAAHIIDERKSVALQAVGDRLFGAESAGAGTEAAVKAWLSQEKRDRRKASKDSGTLFVPPNYSEVPWDIMAPYAEHDVRLQREVCDVIYPAIERNPEFKALYEMEQRVLATLYHAEHRGIPFDRNALIDMEASLLPGLDAARDKCVVIVKAGCDGFDNFNPGSPKQISEALDRMCADTRLMSRSTDTKQLKTDEENLVACPHPLAQAVLEFRSKQKLYAMLRRILHGDSDDEKFPEPYLTGEDRVHPNFRQCGARTGRMSCSNPNFQQFHRDNLSLRYCVQAGPGKKLVVCDLEGIELRLLAAFAGDGPLTEMFKRGEDPHAGVADLIGLRDHKRPDGSLESARSRGKRWNYLKNYGGGQKAGMKWLQMSKQEFQAAKARYESAFPEVKGLEARILEALYDKGYVKTPWGRRHRCYNQNNADREAYKFTAALLQGTAGDLFKDSAARVHAQGVPLIAFVHDELIAEVDEADAEEAGHILEEALTTHPVVEAKVPLEAEAMIVDRWSDAKTPGWKPDYGKDS